MSIDWITVAAQLANFLVLVWLLKRFLYRPILDGIDAREAEIAERMQVAVRAKEEANAAEAVFRAQQAALQSEQATATEALRRQAEEEKDALLKEVHDRIDRERTAWAAHLQDEARSFTAKMHKAGGHALLELTRKALIDLADETLEARIALHLGKQIAAMDQDLEHAAGAADDAVIISHEALPKPIEKEITIALQRRFPKIDVRFEADPAMALGLSLRIGGAQLAWTVDTYIDGLDTHMTDQLAAGSEVRPQ
ncbi:ATP synthase F0 subcomplex B subunit [Poseidonocella pacifica]|uniref:ATP synthase subunit b n=1 Tax=Poseidonocella pacifica TaxID=871651 RepID=A0A1I0UYH1_9RHOB|nr:F0F1 ATP synthase subunit B [Poseidonocella pacifica]SFA69091.1 ATP synthase F0 subcomplex B subunit [Poseidonocella pacifica]